MWRRVMEAYQAAVRAGPSWRPFSTLPKDIEGIRVGMPSMGMQPSELEKN